MPLPVVTDGYMCAQQLILANQPHPYFTVHTVVVENGPLTPSAVANQFADAYANSLMAVIASNYTMGITRVTPLDGTSITVDWVTPSFGHAGGHTTGSEMLPASCAFGITWQSNTRGRSHRGRTYLPGVVDDQVASTPFRTLTSTAHSALQTAAAGFLTHLAGEAGNLALEVLSRKLGLATPVAGARANGGVVEQRRRYEHVAHD